MDLELRVYNVTYPKLGNEMSEKHQNMFSVSFMRRRSVRIVTLKYLPNCN